MASGSAREDALLVKVRVCPRSGCAPASCSEMLVSMDMGAAASGVHDPVVCSNRRAADNRRATLACAR